MDNTARNSAEARTAQNSNSFPLASNFGSEPGLSTCEHTLHLFDGQGKITGSWHGEETENGIRYSCRHCGKFYGYQPNEKTQKQHYQAYLEQQRRMGCPGCGEEPFMG